MQSILLCALLTFVPQQDMFDGSLEQNNVVLLPNKDETGYFLRVQDKDPRAEKAKVTVVYLNNRNKKKKRDFNVMLLANGDVRTDYIPTKPEDVQSIVVEVTDGSKKIATASWKH